MNRFVRTILMTAFATEDDLFQDYTKKELINGFLQKPIHLNDLRVEVDNQLHTYELLKQESFIKIAWVSGIEFIPYISDNHLGSNKFYPLWKRYAIWDYLDYTKVRILGKRTIIVFIMDINVIIT